MVIKVAKIQWDKNFDLNDAVRWVAQRFGISGENVEEDEAKSLEDWKILANYDRIQEIEVKDKNIVLKIQSVSDIITNSSTEVFMVYDDTSFKNIKDLVNAILSLNKDNTYTFDDLFTVEASFDKEGFISMFPEYKDLSDSELLQKAYEYDDDNYDGYPLVNSYVVKAKSNVHDKVAVELSKIDQIFQTYARYC